MLNGLTRFRPKSRMIPFGSLRCIDWLYLQMKLAGKTFSPCQKNNLMWGVADQLHRSLGSISANLTEGYSRSKGLDRARFFEISLGSARESRDWYYKSRHVLSTEVIKHRMSLITQIVSMLVPMIQHQRSNAIREEKAEYNIQISAVSLDSEVPFP